MEGFDGHELAWQTRTLKDCKASVAATGCCYLSLQTIQDQDLQDLHSPGMIRYDESDLASLTDRLDEPRSLCTLAKNLPRN